MDLDPTRSVVAFAGVRRIAAGPLRDVAARVKAFVDSGDPTAVLVFDAVTSEPVELDLRGSVEDVLGRLAATSGPAAAGSTDVEGPARRGPGRPKLGVEAHEVTLLPRHWEWLLTQTGGASVTLRKLVEEARRASGAKDRVRMARDATYRFMLAVAGDEPGFEEAMRALYAGERARFEAAIAEWPAGVRDHALTLAEDGL